MGLESEIQDYKNSLKKFRTLKNARKNTIFITSCLREEIAIQKLTLMQHSCI